MVGQLLTGTTASQIQNAVQSVASAPNATSKAGKLGALNNQLDAGVSSGKISKATASLISRLASHL